MEASGCSKLPDQLRGWDVDDPTAITADEMDMVLLLYLIVSMRLTEFAGTHNTKLPEKIQRTVDRCKANSWLLVPCDLVDLRCIEMRIPIDDPNEKLTLGSDTLPCRLEALYGR